MSRRYAVPMLLILLLLPLACTAQEVENPQPANLVTVNFDKTPLRAAAEEVLRDTDIKLKIETGEDTPVTLQLQDCPRNQVLLLLLRVTGLNGRIEDGTFIISPRPKDLLPRGDKPIFPPPPGTLKPAGPTVRVGLNSGIGRHGSITVSCSGRFRIGGLDQPERMNVPIDSEQVTLSARNGSVEVRRLGREDMTCKGPVRIEAQSPTTAIEVVSPKVKHARYAGILEVTARGSVLHVVNEVPLDEYVRGVVPTEIPASFHPEAQKALVVAARTYAVRNCDRHKSDGFNMCDSIHCQGFAGASRDAEWVNRLVDSTRGEIMTHKGEPIYALYSADCGGMTQNSEDSGMIKAPYLRSVSDNVSGEPCLVVKKQPAPQSTAPSDPSDQSEPSDQPEETACPAPAMTEFEKPTTGDYCASSRAHTWTRTYSAADLEKVFNRSSSTKVGKLTSMEFAEYDCSGRVRTIVLKGDAGEKRLTGTRFRDLFGLSTIMSTRMALTVSPEGKYVIEGRGYGHGVGLCQWGANGLAKSDPKWTYIEILRHYYTDIEIKILGDQ